jgi:hypothetical protein
MYTTIRFSQLLGKRHSARSSLPNQTFSTERPTLPADRI